MQTAGFNPETGNEAAVSITQPVATFTPGPWKYSLNVGPTKALVVEPDGSTIVEIGNRTHDSRFVANVRLIAAATDLYAALKASLTALLSDPPDGPQKTVLADDVIYHLSGQKIARAIELARSALAKVEQSQ